MDFQKLMREFENCPCGQEHTCTIRDVVIEKGAVRRVGEILARNGFPQQLLVVADKTTLAAAEGILPSLSAFHVQLFLYDTLRVAKMSDVNILKACIDGGAQAILSVGTGSLNDIARLAAAEKQVPLCLFGTAPSMDGFASYGAPIVDKDFKISYAAKSPEVIIADTEILARAPIALKSSGFGDMVAKYVGLIDWQVSHLVKGEAYCEKVAALTRYATDRVMSLCDKITLCDEESAAAIFEGLLMTGIAMSFTKTSRPASGTEHIVAHCIECMELLEGKIPNYHGEDVGVATLMVLHYYDALTKLPSPHFTHEVLHWEEIDRAYGRLAPSVHEINRDGTATDGVDPARCEALWEQIVQIVHSVPSYAEVKAAMLKAGCKTTLQEIGKPDDLMEKVWRYHPYMRNRLSLLRLTRMMEPAPQIEPFSCVR